MKLVVNVENARELLTTNREKHINEHRLQLDAWKVEYEKFTNQLKEWSASQGEDGKFAHRPSEPQKPKYHVHSYDKLLRKLEVHVVSTIELSTEGYGSNEYDQIFENQFEWSNSFQGLTAAYINNGTITADKISSASISNAMIGNIGE